MRGRSARLSALPGKPGVLPALEAVLDEAFSEPSDESHRRTRAVVVLKDGRVLAERYAPGFARHTPLIGWSMTKSITHALVGIAVGDGLMDPSEPLPAALRVLPDRESTHTHTRADSLLRLPAAGLAQVDHRAGDPGGGEDRGGQQQREDLDAR